MLEQSKVERYTINEQMQLLEATLLLISQKQSDVLTLIKNLNHTEEIDTLSNFLRSLGNYFKSYNELQTAFYELKKEIK
jgi:hypothetical protein